MPNINLFYYLLAGGIFGSLALKTGIPAAPLAGALIGTSILSVSGKVDIAQWPIGTRTILEIGIGQLKQVDNIFLNQGFRRILKEKDLQGIDRVVVYQYKSTKYIV